MRRHHEIERRQGDKNDDGTWQALPSVFTTKIEFRKKTFHTLETVERKKLIIQGQKNSFI